MDGERERGRAAVFGLLFPVSPFLGETPCLVQEGGVGEAKGKICENLLITEVPRHRKSGREGGREGKVECSLKSNFRIE